MQEATMSMNAGDGQGQRSEINVTPLIDVLLVLLIIFMVIQPTIPLGLDTSVPQAPKTTSPAGLDPRTIVVQIRGNGTDGVTYMINEQWFDRAELEPKLASIFAVRSEKTMFLKGDAELEYSLVADVINDARRAGAQQIAILTPRTGLLSTK